MAFFDGRGAMGAAGAPLDTRFAANAHIVAFSGDIDFSRKSWIVGKLERIERFGSEAFTVIDLSRVTYLDSALINALATIARRRLHCDWPSDRICILATARSHVWRLLTMTRLDRAFRVLDAETFPNVNGGQLITLDFRHATPSPRTILRRLLRARI